MMPPSSPPEPSGDLRASDAERERVAEALRRHHVDGRIDTDELQERLERCYAARTGSDLDALLADLPGEAPSASEIAFRTAKCLGRSPIDCTRSANRTDWVRPTRASR